MVRALEDSVWEIAWSDGLSVGIPEIDEEHRRFIGLVNELNGAIAGRQPKARVERLLDDIVADARNHFAHEERLLAERSYPGAKQHAAVHAGLLIQITAAIHDVQDSEWSRFWIETGLAVKNVLIDHLLHEDMRYRDYFFPTRK